MTRPLADPYAGLPMRIAYLIDPDGIIRKGYDVTDVGGFAAEVLADVLALRDG